jgi:hypothetical protein
MAPAAVNVRSPLSKEEYFPFTNPPSGTLLPAQEWPQNKDESLLFQSITIGKPGHELEFKNRIFVAPFVHLFLHCISTG